MASAPNSPESTTRQDIMVPGKPAFSEMSCCRPRLSECCRARIRKRFVRPGLRLATARATGFTTGRARVRVVSR